MFRLFFLLSVFTVLMPEWAGTQSNFKDTEETLGYYADVMVNASKASHRIDAETKFRNLFVQALSNTGSFDFPFDSLIWISKLEPNNRSFRVFTWQLKAERDTTNYFGVVQLSNGNYFFLEDYTEKRSDLEYETFSPDMWYGQMYYNLHEFRQNGKDSYLLFGYRELSGQKKQKIAEQILIRDNTVFFGEEDFFKSSRHGAYRLVMEYASVAQANLLYDEELDMIVFDHLTPVINPYESNQLILVPDGTYEGYFLEEGKWKYKEKLFEEKYESPPVQGRQKNKDKKDLFGR